MIMQKDIDNKPLSKHSTRVDVGTSQGNDNKDYVMKD